MRAILLLLAVCLAAGLTGCGADEPPETKTWISPAKVEIENFYPGATAECPVTIHYGPTQADRYTSVTEGQTTDFAILSRPLHADSLDSVQAVISDNEEDDPAATGYDPETRTLYLDGLARNTSRTLEIRYSHGSPARFAVYYRKSTAPATGFEPAPEGAQDWVAIADPMPLLAPFETREIPVTVALPGNATVPERWEFLIAMVNTSMGGNINVEMCSRWMVSMRQDER